MVNVATNTEKKKLSEISTKAPSLSERDVKHTKILNIKDLNKFYTFGEKLGKGVFGTVIEVTDKQSKNVWALKIVDKKNVKGHKINTIENEVKILRIVKHPHIIHLEKTYESYSHIYLVIERCTTELSLILKQKKVFTEHEARIVLNHLSNAIAYLHKHDIVHRDIKLENILTAPNPNDPTDELYIKVSDFGLGIIKSCNKPEHMLSGKCGTLAYMAPEIISRSKYSQQCDIWAMGVIFYLLLTGNYPFYSKSENSLIGLICNYDPINSIGFTVAIEAKNLMSKMLEKNPALRISAAEVNRHPWIRGEKDDSSLNVLDMMQQWRSEMMVNQESGTTDWEKAFSTLDNSRESTNTKNSINTADSPPTLELLNSDFSQENLVTEEFNRGQKKNTKQKFRKILKARDVGSDMNCETLIIQGKKTKLIKIGKT